MSHEAVDWDRVYRSNYEMLAFCEIHWLAKARGLYESAKKLEPEVRRMWESYRAHAANSSPILQDYYEGPYFMLLAFAVENLLKAAAVARNSIKYKQSFRATHKFPKELQSHDLFELATHVGLILQGHDEDLLRRLTRSAVWFGRYPAPLRHSDMAGTVRFADGNDYSVSWFGANDVEELNALVLGLPARLGFSNEEWGHAT